MTREQRRAMVSHADVSAVGDMGDRAVQKRYATVVYQLTMLVRTAGLVQALHFVNSLTNSQKKEQAERLLKGLAGLIKDGKLVAGVKDADSLLKAAREASLAEYILLTREVTSALVWYRRFVQAILKISATDVQEDEN
jgi:CRISPR-associated protein Cmr5